MSVLPASLDLTEIQNAFIAIQKQVSAVNTQLNTSTSTITVSANLNLAGQSYTVVFVNTGSNTINIYLDSAKSSNVSQLMVVKVDNGTGQVSIQVKSGDSIGGIASTFSLYAQGDYAEIQTDSIKSWWVTSTSNPILRNVITTTQTQSSSTVNTWYNKGGSLALTPGIWDLSWSASILCSAASGVEGTLSTSPTTESDIDFTFNGIDTAGGSSSGYKKKRITISTNTTYYLNCLCFTTGNLSFVGGATTAGVYGGSIIIEARRMG